MSNDPTAEHSARLLRAFDFAQESADQTERHQQKMSDLFLALLDVMDSFDRLRDPPGDEPGARVTGLVTGSVALIADQLESVLAGAGVEPEICLGEVADPRQQEIVEAQPTDTAGDDVILAVSRRGWRWNGRPLRRSRVVVAQSTLEEKRR